MGAGEGKSGNIGMDGRTDDEGCGRKERGDRMMDGDRRDFRPRLAVLGRGGRSRTGSSFFAVRIAAVVPGCALRSLGILIER